MRNGFSGSGSMFYFVGFFFYYCYVIYNLNNYLNKIDCLEYKKLYYVRIIM